MMANFGTRSRIFTIYDAMVERGDFRKNSANVGSMDDNRNVLYKGPIEYPKMLYHPDGEEEVIVNASWEKDADGGGKYLGEKRQMKFVIVNNEEEEEKYVDNGWHDHPAKALKRAIEINKAKGIDDKRIAPPISSGEHIGKLEREIEELKKKLAANKMLERDIHTPTPVKKSA